jgi:type I restriction enzyme, S subunit
MEKAFNVPKLRFSGYDGDWKEVCLEDISEKVMYGMNAAATTFDGVHKYIRITDIEENSRSFVPNPLSSPDGTIEDKYKLVENDIVFARTGASVGKSYLYNKLDGDLYFAGFLIKFSITKGHPYFVYTQTLRDLYNKWIQLMSMRSGQPGINAEEYKSFTFNTTELSEQTKIANFLSSVDDKLSQLKKKKSLMEQYKKGVMQKIFSQELRFKDDDGNDFSDWEEKEGNFIFESISDKKHNSDLPILAITQEFGAIPRDLIDYNVTVTDKSVDGYKVVQKGDFIISLRSFQGGIEYSNYLGICSPAYIILRPFIAIDDQFYKNFFKTEFYIKLLNKNLEGIRDGKMISFKYFSEISLPYPSQPEQIKIANFLSALDDKINQCGMQIEKMELWKKGLLQQMFC